jgi:uncharacterized NAD(P)/FAD-binding protein YdhS
MAQDKAERLPPVITSESFAQPYAIAIIGGGYSGTVLAIQLLRLDLLQTNSIALIEKTPRSGPGLAYATQDECCLLNVPAGNMSALADDPGHFVRYCQVIDLTVTPSSFVPRRLYGQYIEDLLKDTEMQYPNQLVRVRGEVIDLELISQDRYRIDFDNKTHINAKKVVLALGHFSSQSLPALNSIPSHFIYEPWDAERFKSIPSQFPIVILGTGHTAIDAVLRLQQQKTNTKIVLISRRGFLPHSHRATSGRVNGVFPGWLGDISPSVRSYTRVIRAQIKKHVGLGGDWRDVFNQIRAHTPALWKTLSLRERKRFLSKILPYWDVHRHRLAPHVGEQIDDLRQGKIIRLVAGRIQSIHSHGNLLKINYRNPLSQTIQTVEAGVIINCTGPNYDLSKVDDLLIKALLRKKYICQDPLQIGLELSDNYQLKNQRYQKQDNLYYIGPMLKARYWEAIAVPELREHVQRLAKILHSK